MFKHLQHAFLMVMALLLEVQMADARSNLQIVNKGYMALGKYTIYNVYRSDFIFKAEKVKEAS